MLPIRRDLAFNLKASNITSWHPAGSHMSHFMNTLSLFFPVGERFFIDSVRHYRDKGVITDDNLKQAVTAFIGQEAMHGREHEDYNQAYADAGFEAKEMEAIVTRLLQRLQKVLPPEHQLSATIALEHFTAILANGLLENPESMLGAEENFLALWNWHALEETEHKAVAYDVYCEVMKDQKLRGYLIRITGLIGATIIFWALVYPFFVRNVQKDGGLLDIKGWWKAFRFQFVSPGIMRLIIGPYLDYFRPGFHPWDHDNRHFLTMVDSLADRYDRKTRLNPGPAHDQAAA